MLQLEVLIDSCFKVLWGHAEKHNVIERREEDRWSNKVKIRFYIPASGWNHLWNEHYPILRHNHAQWLNAIFSKNFNFTSKHCMLSSVFPTMQIQSIYWLVLICRGLVMWPRTGINWLQITETIVHITQNCMHHRSAVLIWTLQETPELFSSNDLICLKHCILAAWQEWHMAAE